jgi:hypothetical protein
MSAQHTPGPWHVDSIHNDGEYGIGPDTHSGFKSFVVCDDKGRALFDSINSDAIEVQEEHGEDDFSAWDAVGLANATLAAAAPDLLAALHDARQWIPTDVEILVEGNRTRVVDVVDAAIAKAEGRS